MKKYTVVEYEESDFDEVKNGMTNQEAAEILDASRHLIWSKAQGCGDGAKNNCMMKCRMYHPPTLRRWCMVRGF